MERLQIERDGGVAIVRLDNPPMNMIDGTMRRELRQVFEDLSQDRTVAAAVLSSTSDRYFCAGRDLKERRSDGIDDEELRTQLDPFLPWRRVQYAIRHCLVPVIAAVEGVAVGGGLGMVGVADMIVAGVNATFGLTEINVGLLGGASKMLRLLGPSKARRMLFLGERFPAAELHRLGGIEEVVEAGRAVARAVEMGQLMATKSPVALRLAKESILRLEGEEVLDNYRTENDYSYRMDGNADSAEARAAFLEKRDPHWTWS